ncbi:AraC family transcriptional regulator [Paenibacillus agricola]|uniref:AraC family transcriptional regulator n=1 Tax=Paenibacillus agricola TaxID=2716264 RepID=A0ABX0J7S1_9BACL|nr:AraC family transcriptional regulator [Paenibacillus agricola]NHN31435.1 AraC family transcriptional regulator [Paenibacillus agricola]
MTFFPIYKQITDYPAIDRLFPIHISINHVEEKFPAHRHDFLECSFVLSGYGCEYINGHAHDMRPGTFTFLLPYQVHELRTASVEPLVLYNCMFDMNLLTGTFGEEAWELLWQDGDIPPFLHTAGETTEYCRRLWEGLFAEYTQTQLPWRQSLIRARLLELLAGFDRERRLLMPAPAIPFAKASRPSLNVWPIIRYVHQHYLEDLSLMSLAEAFGHSPSRITECIRDQVGVTFLHFLHEVRVRHACSLLLTTDHAVTDIGYEVGFQSFKTFSRIFREQKGTTPTAYRRNGGL